MALRESVRAVVMQGDSLLVMHRNKFGQEYYTLIGGGIEPGEEQQDALRRELLEESGLTVGTLRLVFTEPANDPYEAQFVYVCEYLGGEPQLAPDSEEALANQEGLNTYTPTWLAIQDLPNVAFISERIRDALVHALQSGFPDNPQALA